MFKELQKHGLQLNALQEGRMIKSYSVIGERSCGTNLAFDLMKLNFHLPFVAVHRWKHGFPDAHVYPDGHLMVVCFRKADDWVRSMYAKPWEAHSSVHKRDFHDFLREPWLGVYGRQYGIGYGDLHGLDDRVGRRLMSDSHPISGLPFSNIFKLRNMKNRTFLSMGNRLSHVVFVQLEYLQDHQEEFVNAIAIRYQLAQKPFERVDFQHGQNRFWKERLANKPKTLSDEDYAFMCSELDLDIEALIGYHY